MPADNHWDEVLPGLAPRVQHEDVVHDSEGQVRRLLEFFELLFEQAFLDFHKTERNVRTPSSARVRRPIFKGSLEQWRNYEAWLPSLKEALGPDVLNHYPLVQS